MRRNIYQKGKEVREDRLRREDDERIEKRRREKRDEERRNSKSVSID